MRGLLRTCRFLRIPEWTNGKEIGMSDEIISGTVRIRVSGLMTKERAGMLAECMNRMVEPDIKAPSTPFCCMMTDSGHWAVFIRNNAIRAL